MLSPLKIPKLIRQKGHRLGSFVFTLGPHDRFPVFSFAPEQREERAQPE